MRDISSRIQRYRLSRYAAPPADPVKRRLRWAWLLGALWLVWVGLLSDHNLHRLWRLETEQKRMQVELAQVEAEAARLADEASDAEARLLQAEGAARGKGYAKPGETVFRYDDGRRDSGSAR